MALSRYSYRHNSHNCYDKGSFIYPTDAQLDCYKMLKFTLKFT